MGNVAFSYRDLGRQKDALAMEKKALEFNRLVFGDDHPAIGRGHVRSDTLYVLCECNS